MEIQELKTFVTIVQQGSFSKAAVKLDYSQGAITIQIKHLEEELGVLLFERLGKRIELTNDGRTFYDYATNILNLISDAKASLTPAKQLQGELVIGTTDSLCTSLMPRILSLFHERYPDVSISLVTDSISGLIHSLNHNDIDLAYLVDQSIQLPHLIKVSETKRNVRFIASSSHPIVSKRNLHLKDFVDEPFILTEKDASYRQLLDVYLEKQGLAIRPFLETKSTDLILKMVQANLGLSFLPDYVLSYPEIERLNVVDFELVVESQVLYHKNKWVTQEMKAFIETLLEIEKG